MQPPVQHATDRVQHATDRVQHGIIVCCAGHDGDAARGRVGVGVGQAEGQVMAGRSLGASLPPTKARSYLGPLPLRPAQVSGKPKGKSVAGPFFPPFPVYLLYSLSCSLLGVLSSVPRCGQRGSPCTVIAACCELRWVRPCVLTCSLRMAQEVLWEKNMSIISSKREQLSAKLKERPACPLRVRACVRARRSQRPMLPQSYTLTCNNR